MDLKNAIDGKDAQEVSSDEVAELLEEATPMDPEETDSKEAGEKKESKEDAKETTSEDAETEDKDAKKTNKDTDKEESKDEADISDEDSLNVADNGEIVDTSADTDGAGQAVMVNNTISSDFFSSAKLKREQTRSKIGRAHV